MKLAIAFLLFGPLAPAQILLPISGGNERAGTPTDSPGAGTYSSTQSVTLSDPTAALIRYTTDGSTPACPLTGTLYTGAFNITVTTTLKAIGCNGVTGGGVLTSVYTISASNNVAIVSGHLGGATTTAGSTVAFSFAGASVTSGNTVLCGVNAYNDGNSLTFTAGMLTKTAGTSTVGTVALDQSSNIASAGQLGVALYSIPISGTGTITLTFNPSQSNEYWQIGCGEFTGLNASRLSTTSTTSGTSANHTTNSVTTTDVGVMVYTATEIATGDFTRTYSNTLIYKLDTGNSTYSGIIQYKILNSSPNTLTDTTGTSSLPWKVAYALYKTS